MTERISERVQGFTESVIREMTRVVMEYFPKTDEMLQEAGERLLKLPA